MDEHYFGGREEGVPEERPATKSQLFPRKSELRTLPTFLQGRRGLQAKTRQSDDKGLVTHVEEKPLEEAQRANGAGEWSAEEFKCARCIMAQPLRHGGLLRL